MIERTNEKDRCLFELLFGDRIVCHSIRRLGRMYLVYEPAVLTGFCLYGLNASFLRAASLPVGMIPRNAQGDVSSHQNHKMLVSGYI